VQRQNVCTNRRQWRCPSHRLACRMVKAARDARLSVALTQHSNRVSSNASIRRRETQFSRAETKTPKRPPRNSMGRLQRQNACTNRRQFGAIRTEPGNLRLLRRRLAEGPEWSETAVSTQEDRASSAAAISAPVNQCGEPWFTRVSEITVWFEVRVLPAPPRSLTQTEISRFIANSPELAGIRRRILSLRNRPGLFNERPSASRRHWESAA
jgi:hypothetical protein